MDTSENFAYHDKPRQLTQESFDIRNLFMTQKLPPAALATAQAPNSGGKGGELSPPKPPMPGNQLS
jgi:hypothetical protein